MIPIRHQAASTMSVFEYTVIEMAKGLLASEAYKDKSLDAISMSAVYLTNRVMERLEEEAKANPAPRQSAIV